MTQPHSRCELVPERISETIDALRRRISERFPESELRNVASDLARLGGEVSVTVEWLARPMWPLRILAWLGVAGLVAVMIGLVLVALEVALPAEVASMPLQTIESALNEIILLAIGIFFLLNAESRLKRPAALRSLHALRSLVHVIDMHQLTKDPERLFGEIAPTASSPRIEYGRLELARYLDYCSEMLSLASKLAALHGQRLSDPVVLAAISDVEGLAAGLSNKIWQKIMILDLVLAPSAVPPRDPGCH